MRTDPQQAEKKIYKFFVAIGFGLLGFCVNFYPLDFAIPPHKASLVLGLLFPLLVSLSWGWKYGLISLTLGLGGQTMWFLWLPNNGWAPFVAIPVYNLWILWHGWCAKRDSKILANIYWVEIFYRLFNTVILYTIFRWVWTFNPSPWAPDVTLTTAPMAFVHFIAFKQLVEGLIILLLAHILLNISIVQKILLIETKRAVKSDYIISAFLLFGLIYWFIASISDYLYAKEKLQFYLTHQGQNLADALALHVPGYELVSRFLFIIICLAAGLIVAKYVAKYQERDEQYQEVVEGTSDLITLVDKEGRFIYVNHMSTTILGVEPEKIIGREAFEFVHPDDRDKTQQWFQQCLDEQILSGSIENRQVNATTGQFFYMLWNSHFHYDVKHHLVSISSIAHNITERKKSELELQRLKAAIDHAEEVVIITDIDGTIQYANPAFSRVTGYDKKEVIGRNPRILKSGRHDKYFYEELWNAISRGAVWRGHITNQKKDGALYTEEATISPVFNGAGKIINFVAVARDVTEELQRDKLLQQAQKMEAIGTMAGGVAHDFNNILGVILGNTELMLEDTAKQDPCRYRLEQIFQASNRAKDLVKQILTFSRQGDQQLVPIEPCVAIKETLKLLRATTPATVSIVQDISRDCGLILADPTQMHQLFMNLFSNAIQAMDEKGTIEVTVDKVALGEKDHALKPDMEPGEYVRLRVGDSGSGMDEATLERVFDPFFTTKKVGEGTGLGLSIVMGIVKSHHGFLDVQSEVGAGTVFTIYFPGFDTTQTVVTEEAYAGLPKGNERVLFVDDEPMLVEIGGKMLERLGYKVTVKSSSTSALETFTAAPDAFDVVITDQTMPDMSGVELAEALLRIRADIPIILYTGYSKKITEEEARHRGIKEYLLKPLDRRQLATAIRKVLDERGLSSAA